MSSNHKHRFMINASTICLGTATYGSDVPPEKAFKLMDTYHQNGGNFIDTANVYASWLEGGEGASEKTIGQWIKKNHLEDQIIIATKGGHWPLDSDKHEGHLTRENIRRHLEQSLERLQLSRVELYWLHRDEPERPVREILETLQELIDEDRIGFIGASNWEVERIAEANACADANGLTPFSASQPRWAMARQPLSDFAKKEKLVPLDQEGVEWHRQSGVAVVPYSSQAQGWFSHDNAEWARGGFNGEAPVAAKYDQPECRERLLATIEVGNEIDATPNQVALATLIAHPFPVHPIIGNSNPDHILDALGAAELELTDEQLRRIAPETFGER